MCATDYEIATPFQNSIPREPTRLSSLGKPTQVDTPKRLELRINLHGTFRERLKPSWAEAKPVRTPRLTSSDHLVAWRPRIANDAPLRIAI